VRKNIRKEKKELKKNEYEKIGYIYREREKK